MKKLFYSFFMLAAMSLTFVACEQKEPEQNEEEKPKVESNCNLNYIETTATEFGQVYLIEITTNDVELTNQGEFVGTGDYMYMQMYANPQEDLSPESKTYQAYSIEEMGDDFDFNEFVMGGAIYEGYPAGTFIATIEDGENTDILFCVGGTVQFEGNATNNTIKINLEFESLTTKEIVTKEFIYKGDLKIDEIQKFSPQRIKFNK